MILRVCIAIPTFDNPTTIVSVVENALQGTKLAVLVVDDGSRVPVQGLIGGSEACTEALSSGRLRVLRTEINCGKGCALQLAVSDAVARGFTHLLTVDGDGQHLISEVEKLVAATREYPWHLIIGNRRMHAVTVPQGSRFGRAFCNFWVQYQTELAVRDSQSGMRLYPLFYLQNMSFATPRYEFEIEVLTRLLWKGVQVRDVDIEVYYPKPEDRISHFRLWKDNVRIVALSTLFVLFSLLRSHNAPRQVGLGVGLGVLIGCTPFFGLHTSLALLTALLFRINAVGVVMGSNISIPPLAPVLALGSLALGSTLLAAEPGGIHAMTRLLDPEAWNSTELLSAAADAFGTWLLGSLVLGTVLGTVIGAIAYAVAKRFERLNARPNWSGTTRGGVFGLGVLKWVLQRLGLRAGYACLLGVVPYFYLFAPRARRALHEYWRILRPETPPWRRIGLVMRHMYRFGQVLMDRAFVVGNPKTTFQVQRHGPETFTDAASQGRGTILLTAHVGGWDLAASLLGKTVLKEPVRMVQFEASGLTFNEVVGSKSDQEVSILNSNETQAIFALHQLLGRKQVVGVMGDRPLGDRYELVQFMGRLAPFDVTPYRLAAATGVPLQIVFGFKSAQTTYDLYTEAPRILSYSQGVDRAVSRHEWAQQFASILEGHLRRYPEQWFNFFSFWSSVPTSPVGAHETPAQNQLLEELQGYAAGVPIPPKWGSDWAADHRAIAGH